MLSQFDSSVHLMTAEATQEQCEAIVLFRAELKKLSGIYEEYEFWLTDSMLQRFLIARQYNISKSFKMLEQALSWRKGRNPDRFFRAPGLQPPDIARFEHECQTGKTYIAGFDRWGRVVVVFNNACQNTNCHEDQISFLSWILEMAIQLSPANRDKYVIFMHLDTFSFWNCPPMKTTIETCKMLVTCLPERLGHCICYHPPGVFHTVFQTLKPFIDKRTTSKMVFLYGSVEDNGDNDKLMCNIIGRDWKTLTGAEQPTVAQGTSPGYVHATVWAQHLCHIETVRAKINAQQLGANGQKPDKLDSLSPKERLSIDVSTPPTSSKVSSSSSLTPPSTPISPRSERGSSSGNAATSSSSSSSSSSSNSTWRAAFTADALAAAKPTSLGLGLQNKESRWQTLSLFLGALGGSVLVWGVLLWLGAAAEEGAVIGAAIFCCSLVLIKTEV